MEKGTHPARIHLIEERKRRQWSQQELADRLGTTQHNVSRWERGQTLPGSYFRTKLCEIFGKSPQELGFLGEAKDAQSEEDLPVSTSVLTSAESPLPQQEKSVEISLPPQHVPSFWPTLLLPLVITGGLTLISVIVGLLDHNPWQGVLVAGLCLLVLACLAFARHVGERLQQLWVEDTAQWVDRLVRRTWVRYRQYYARFLTFQHRDFDIKGLSTQSMYTLELEQVFVDLRLDPRALHEANVDPLAVRPPAHLLAGQHAIWSYLEAEALQHQNLIILGPPGSGKTTLLKHMALTLVHPQKRRTLSQHLQRAYHTPFLLLLREHAHLIQRDPTFSLVKAIESRLADWDRPVPTGWVQHQLHTGKCLILLDGLDEVADRRGRECMVAWIQVQMRKYAQNRFMLSSRPFGYRDNPVSGVMILEVQPFTFEHMQQFIHKWYQANEIMSSQKDDAGVRFRAKTGARDLIQRMQHTPALASLAVNPLLLTMIATIHRYRSTLPGKRVDLYAEICEVFLGKRQQARDQPIVLRPAQSISVLRPLAYEMMVRECREITREEAQRILAKPLQLVDGQMAPVTFLQMIENMSGLLLEQKSGSYSFAHLTFQEYLAALHIEKQGLEAVLLEHVGESWWAETTRLYSAQTDATPLIQACLPQAETSVAHLELALECLEEALQVQFPMKAHVNHLIKQGAEGTDPHRQNVIAETLLNRRLKELVALEGEVFRDTSLILCAEYQLFLDAQDQGGNAYQPDHWKEQHFPPGEAFHPVLGVRPSAARAFCTWLTQREQSMWCYRLPRPGEYQAATIHARPAWLAFPAWDACYGYWEEHAIFTWLQQPVGEAEPLDLDMEAFDERQHVVKLEQEADWEQHFSRYLLRASASVGADDLAHAHELVRARARVRVLAQADTLAQTLARTSTSTRMLVRARTRTLVRDLEMANARLRTIDLTRDLTPDSTRRLTLAFVRNLALASVGMGTDALSKTRDLSGKSTSDLATLRTLASVHTIDLARVCTLAIALANASSRVLANPTALGSSASFALARLWALLSICVSFSAYEIVASQIAPVSLPWRRSSVLLRKNKQNQWIMELQEALNRGIEIGRRLEQLEQRKKGEQPAYEGILIIRERRHTEEEKAHQQIT